MCCGVGEQPTASPPKWARVYLWVLTGTHLCDDPPRQGGESLERRLCSALLLRFVLCGCRVRVLIDAFGRRGIHNTQEKPARAQLSQVH